MFCLHISPHMHCTTCIERAYRYMLKPLLFKLNPETAHDLFTDAGAILGKYSLMRRMTKWFFHYEHPLLQQEFFGLSFPNPLGLSAGFDKDVLLPTIMKAVGFGYVQVGSITWKAYEGNPKPRLYRLTKDQGLVVNYGLKNKGVTYAIKQLQKTNVSFPISISIAKTNCTRTSGDEAGIEDYMGSLQETEKAGVGDFYTINVSCPNTFGGEPFTTPDRLDKLLSQIDTLHIKKPIFIKMPVSMPWDSFDKLLQVATQHNVQGVIIANLLKQRESLHEKNIPVPGGISGKPTQAPADELIHKTYANYGDTFLIVGVGGIFSAEDAYHKIKSGASLLQLITGMIFKGPQLIGQINKGLVALLEKDGYTSLDQAIGAYHKEK